MLLNSLILLLLSNSITSRRDKSILYSRVTITILLISAFIPLWLGWSIPHFCILILLTLAVIYLLLIYDSSILYEYYNGDMLAIFMGGYISLVENTIAYSAFNNTNSVISIVIGLSMLIIGLINKDTEPLLNKIIFIINNKKLTLIIILIMFLVISTINIILLLLNVGFTVDTNSPTLFIYTFFSKVIMIKLVFVAISCYINKEIKLINVSLSIPSVILMILLGSINYFYVVPQIKVVIFLCLAKLDSIYTCELELSKTNTTHGKTLPEGFFSLITKTPILGRYLAALASLVQHNNTNDRFSPFRVCYLNIMKNIITIFPLTKISKFTPVLMPIFVDNKSEVFYSHKGTFKNLEELLRNNNLYLTGLISNFVSNYSNLTCKIHLTCDDQLVTIYTSYINGHLDEFTINKTNINFANKVDKKVSNIYSNSNFKEFSTNSFDSCPKYNWDYFYDPSVDRTRELLRLTDPSYKGSHLQVFMQGGFSYHDYPIQEGESSRGEPSNLNLNRNGKRALESEDPYDNPYPIQESEDPYPIQEGESYRGEPSYLGKGKERALESEDPYDTQTTTTKPMYPCIDIIMKKIEGKNFICLDFDPVKLTNERDTYLDQICIMGRTALFDYYNKLIEDSMEVNRIVNNYTLKDIVVESDIGITGLYYAFIEKNNHIIQSNNLSINPAEICPFSKIYIDGNPDYSDEYLLDNSGNYILDKPDEYYLDNSDNYISDDCIEIGKKDFIEAGKKDLKEFELTEIDTLIGVLRSRQIDFLNKKSVYDKGQKCNLKDLNFRLSREGVFSDIDSENAENEITLMLTKLFEVKRGWFGKKKITLSVNILCSKLRDWSYEYPINDLTDEHVISLTKELKSRLQKLSEDRKSEGGLSKYSKVKDIGLKCLSGLIVEGTAYGENELTRLLGMFKYKNPGVFTYDGEASFSCLNVKGLYIMISKSIWKPLTKDEIILLINGLENRKTDYYLSDFSTEIRSKKSKYCTLSDISLSIHTGVIIEQHGDSTEYEFTRLLEKLCYEKPDILPASPMIEPNVDILINNLRKFVDN